MTADLMPFTYEGAPVRTIVVDGDVEFVAADVCRILGHTNPSAAVAGLDDDERGLRIVDTPSGAQQMVTVTEPGLYTLIIRSRKSEAKSFRRWVTHEVLPAIRKTGSYSITAAIPQTYAAALRAAADESDRADREHAAREVAETRVAELEPRAHVADQLLDAKGDLEVSDVAKVLVRAGIRTGQHRLFAELEGMRWVYRHRGDGRWRIYQTAVDAGYMRGLPQSHKHPRTGLKVVDPPQPRVTPKGLQRLLELLGPDEQQLDLALSIQIGDA
jgi:anti-repressor protein